MRDPVLKEAIDAAGGVSALAQRMGISQPSVTNWKRVPSDRVAAVEAATGISRTRLRPDLYSDEAAKMVDDVDAARAQEYSLLATLLVRAPDAALLARLARVGGDATPLGLAHLALADAAANVALPRAELDYFNLFIGVGRGDVLPYASYYLTGFLHERPLARLRDDLAPLGIERVEGNNEPEDHAATLCEIMAALADGRFPAPDDAQRTIFQKHMQPWMERFFADVEHAAETDFYRRVGALGRLFIQIETEAFGFAQ